MGTRQMGLFQQPVRSLTMPQQIRVAHSPDADDAFMFYGLAHRQKALEYAMQFARSVAPPLVDRFVGMYVNDLTVAYGPRGRAAVERLLDRAHAQGLLPHRVIPEFVE
jgi:predicted solute-binding protein